MKKMTLMLSIAAIMLLQACGDKRIVYRVDGNIPQEKYSVVMKPGVKQSWEGTTWEEVSEVIPPSGSRTSIIRSLLIGVDDGIKGGDTYYKLIPANENYLFSATYDKPTVPDYNILVRDMVVNAGVTEEKTMVDAYELTIVDTALFNSRTSSEYTGYPCEWCNSDSPLNESGRWYTFIPVEKTADGLPQKMYCFMSVLRYWYGIPVFFNKDIDQLLTIFVDDDFYNASEDFDAVNTMIREKYGLALEPSDRQMVMFTYKVK